MQGKQMKKTILKILKYVPIGVSIYLAVLLIEFCCIYAAQKDNTWNYLKEVWEWYSSSFF